MKNEEITQNDVEEILNAHNRFYDNQKTRSIDFRIEQLKILRNGIEKYQSKILEALYKDLGKSEFESYTTEIGFILSSIRYAIKNLKRWAKPKKVKTPIYLFPSKSYIISEPYGTALIIGPYNYPFQLLIEPLVGAIAAGNCIVLKPSENVPNVSRIITEMISTIFNKNYIRCVEGGIETNSSLINGKFDYIFFTGSVSVGKIVMESAAKNLVPVTLELGGKSPVIVDESADIKIAARRIIWGKTLNAGQTCVAPDYLLVHESVKKELIKELKNSIQEFYEEDVLKSKDFGRIVNKKHFNRLNNIIEAEKENIIHGGKSNEDERFIEPTLIETSSWNCASMADELFGPILPIITYNNLDSVINDIKNLPKPLALYLFTTNKKVEEKVLREISSGGVCINDTISHLISPELPFGGVGNSGIGSYHGEYSFITFSHKRSVVSKSNKINLTMLFPPYSEKNLKLIKMFLH